MCGSTKAPKVVQDDPVADQAAADAKSTQEANSQLALRRKQRAQNSLLTIGMQGTKPGTVTPYNLLGAAVTPGATLAPASTFAQNLVRPASTKLGL